jgi:hypothetical protein
MRVSIKSADISIIERLTKLQRSTYEDKRLYENLDTVFDKLKLNPYYGDRIRKKRIPKFYLNKYHIDNMLVIPLPDAWRLLYSVERFEDSIIVIIVDFLSHTEYDRIFGYSRK